MLMEVAFPDNNTFQDNAILLFLGGVQSSRFTHTPKKVVKSPRKQDV